MLKQYLEAGDIRFIGSTPYEEYNRYMAQSKGSVRRFQQIDIKEPTEEAVSYTHLDKMEKINVKELNDNVFETIGKEWMLVCACLLYTSNNHPKR